MKIDRLTLTATFGLMLLLAQGAAAQADPVVCVGDVLQVSVFESSAAGVPAGNFVTLPSQKVEPTGTILLPFAGRINAAGRSIAQIERDIETQLATRAVEPRIQVAVVEHNATSRCLPPK